MRRVLSSVSIRLTLWYVGMLGVALTVLSGSIYVYASHNLYDRLDAGLASTLQLVETALESSTTETVSDNQALSRALQSLHFPKQTVTVMDAGGGVLAERSGPGGPRLRLPASPLRFSDTVQFYELHESKPGMDDSCRAAFEGVTGGSPERVYNVIVSQSVEPLEDQMDLLFYVLWAFVPAILILAGIGGWFLARKSLMPVIAMAECAQRISAENLDQRLPVTNTHDEFGRLAAAFNELLARLNNSFARQRQFMADASHELRTPLSVIRTASAVLLEREDRSNEEYREALGIVEEQSRRLTRVVENMFTLARSDAGNPDLHVTRFYLDELLLEIARAAAVLAAPKNIRLDVGRLPEAQFQGDEDLLRQMIWNLVENAIKFTPQGGRIRVGLELVDSQYVITVTDSGSGIAAIAQPHIFDRFYRADPARSRVGGGDDGGAGLGLPIARCIAEAHRGHLELRKSDHSGSTFAVALPVDGDPNQITGPPSPSS
jgi:two-component system OmpR family sensor kinase